MIGIWWPTGRGRGRTADRLLPQHAGVAAGPVDGPTVGELLQRVKAGVGAQERQDLPFEHVVEVIEAVTQHATAPLFQVMFAGRTNRKATSWPGLRH